MNCRRQFVLALVSFLCSGITLGAEQVTKRIITLAPNLTELAFTAGAGDLIVGAVEYSDFPPAAGSIPRIGDAFRVDFERVLALRPDVVLAWQSGTSAAMTDRLRELQVPVKMIATFRLDDIGAALRDIGRLAGTFTTADAAAKQFEQQIGALRAEYAGREVLSVFVEVSRQPLYTVNGQQIMSELVALCGGHNVFANLEKFAPQVSIEAVIAENPQVIISTDSSTGDAAAEWSRWRHIDAVKHGNVFTLPPDDLTRATTRLASGAKELCRVLDKARHDEVMR